MCGSWEQCSSTHKENYNTTLATPCTRRRATTPHRAGFSNASILKTAAVAAAVNLANSGSEFLTQLKRADGGGSSSTTVVLQ